MADLKRILALFETSRAYGRDLIEGFIQYAQLKPHWQIHLVPPFYVKKDHRGMSSLLKSNSFDGVIGHVVRESDFKAIRKSNIPSCLQCIYKYENDQEIDCANTKIGEYAFDYFYDKGFYNYAFFGYKQLYWSEQRRLGYLSKAQKAGYNVSEFSAKISVDNKSYEQLRNWLNSLVKPVALFVCNDDWSCVAAEICEQMDIRVPGEISILGVDNDYIVCKTSLPNLSSINLSTKKAGYKIARLLDDKMNKKNVHGEKILIEPSGIHERQSTNIFIVDNINVARALEYIHSNSDKPIQVRDVVDKACISRRKLQDIFKEKVGRTIHEEIKRSNAKYIAKLLIETDLSITEISHSVGFCNLENISRFFRNAYGISPRDYRKKYKI